MTKTDIEALMTPKACKGVKCMIKGCRNLASHKVGEENIWHELQAEWNDESQRHRQFNQTHNLTTYLCESHFHWLMTRETEYNTIEDKRFENRPED